MQHLPVEQLRSRALPRVQPRVVRSHHLSVRQHLLLSSVEQRRRLSQLLLRVGLLSPRSLLSLG
jgi:hypothetical protein